MSEHDDDIYVIDGVNPLTKAANIVTITAPTPLTSNTSPYTMTANINPGNLLLHSHGRTVLTIQAENGGDAIIKTHRNKVNLDEVADMMKVLKERLLIITPDFEKHEKYPALKEAYDNYKLIEALCKDDQDDK